ncbi:MAG: 16S rRNA (adenine(1518)-N(6)/adenine(1519)-N(6))-dimethyltransferase RsmA [Clostridia bacterium]|nr:16S rRNA (adenine(1518)-N(6)/adenine(1519)-N(6))-dimethyltransferase RsmA [Clostridia bacterium]
MREILKKHNFRYKKKWGQNFIFEQNLLQRIVTEAGIVPGDCVVEIGAGVGTLTRELLAQGAQVLAIEIDRTLLPLLASLFAEENVVFVQGDVMQLDLDELTRAQGWSGYKVVANLPYYITTPLVMKLLEEEAEIEDIVVMMQKEVAARLMAVPGTKEYGALTLAVQYYAEPEILFPVSRHVFQPVPQVDSAVIRLKPRKEPPVQVEDKALLFRIIKAAFGQRRKVLLNSLLKTHPGVEKKTLGEVLVQAGIDSRIRGEVLSLEQFAILSNIWVAKIKQMI